MKGTVPRTAPPTGPGLFDRPEPRGPRILSVSELTAQLKGAVEPRFRDVWVSGEVAGVRRQSSGHVYFTLKDAQATVDAAIWSSVARRIRFDLVDGIEVVARGKVEIYAPRGRDTQRPHSRDEIYVVLSGSGIYVNGRQRSVFTAGDVLLAAAGERHRFDRFTDDFCTWVLFYGPPGGEQE